MHKATFTVAAALLLAGAASARPNLIGNGGFETGDFTDWSQFGDTSFTGVGNFSAPHSGTYEAFFGPIFGTGGISQSAAVGVGDVVTVSFWLAHDGGLPNSFSADFDGADLLSLVDDGGFGYTHYSFSGLVVGTAGASLDFTTYQVPAYWHLDDVSVSVDGTIPLPTAASLGFAGLAGLGLRRRR